MIVPLFGLGTKGKSATVNAQRHVNLYAEIQRDQDKAQMAFYGTPGTTLRKSFGDTPVRGWIAIGNLYYAVHRGTLYSVNNAGTATSLGTLNTTTGRVDMAYDGAVILMVDGTNGYTFTISGSTFAQISDGDFPNGANTCTWLDGQFIVDTGDSDSFYISPDGTNWDALDFATAESQPDGIVRVFQDNGEVLLFGETTTEPWGNVGGADFPFQPIKGAIVEFGLAARWSLTKFNSGLGALMKNENGQVQVMFITGYVPKPISTQEVDHEINSYATVSDATAFAYMLGGHPMYQINFPTVMKSWLYDASTTLWTQLEYGLNGERHRGEMSLDFLNKTIIADYENGNIYNLDPEVYTDNGTAIAREIVTRHFFNGNERVIVDELFVDFEPGVGLAGNGEASGTNYMELPGASGDYASTPDSAALDITGDIEFVVYAAADDWTPSGSQTFVGKWTLTANQLSYVFYVGATGFLALSVSTTGAVGGIILGVSTAAPVIQNGQGIWLRATRNVTTGDVNFYTSDEPISTAVDSISWSQLGTTVSTAAGAAFSGSASLEIGAELGGSSQNFDGKIYKALVYNGIGGTLVASFDATATSSGASAVIGITGETYTLQGNASIAGDYVRATQGANPQAMLTISRDGGMTFGNELWTTIGMVGRYLNRVVWRRLGLARDWVFKVRITDPVKIAISFAAIRART